MPVVIGPINKTGPIVQFYLIADILSQSSITNQTVVRVTRQAWNTGNSSSNYAGAGVQRSVIFDGSSYALIGQHAATPFLPSGVAPGALRWSEFEDVTLTHDANGYWLGGTSLSLRMDLSYGVVNDILYGSLTIPRIPRVPYKPPAPVLVPGSTGTVGFDYSFAAPADNGGSAITTFNHQVATDSGFGTIVQSFDDATSPANVTGIAPGTTHWVRYRPVNAVGAGPWSDALSVTTLPSVPPGMDVTPSLSGLDATVELTPPGGVSGVTLYNIQYRVFGTTTPTDTSTATTSKTVTGLNPGTTYEWRSNAEIGGYTSPWTDWVSIPQPSPNTNPGSFFDGNTDDTPEVTYGWVGTTNNSFSTATGFGVEGWLTFDEGLDDATGAGVVGWVSGGIYGSHMARVTVFTTFTDGGFIAGVDFEGAAEVEENTLYVGSIHYQGHRTSGAPQRMQAGLIYYNAGGVEIGSTWADSVVVIDAEYAPVWTRLAVSGTTPTGTARVAVVVRDVNSGGGFPWMSGDVFYLDAAMVSLGQLFSYFDGGFADTTMYTFSWDGLPNQSSSERIELPQEFVDPLADPDCPPPPTPPTPPEIPSDCIIEVGTWRRYTVAVPAAEVSLWSSTLPTIILNTDGDGERQVRIRVFANPDNLTPDLVTTNAWEAEMILTYIPPDTEITMDGVTQRVWASVSGADPIPANQLLYGTNGVPASWPELRCGIGYVMTFDVPLDAPSGNLSTRVQLTARA